MIYNILILQQIKEKWELFAILALILSMGAIVSYTTAPVKDDEPFDIYVYRVGQVEDMMNRHIEHPTPEKIDSVYLALMEQGQWANRQNDEKKAYFEAYLESCNDVRLSLKNKSGDLQEKIDIMNEKKKLI